MCAEVHDGISLESMPSPEVGTYVGIGWWGGCSVDDGEVVTADTSYGLREQDDMPILDTCRGQLRCTACGTGHVLAGYVSVGLFELLDLLRAQVLLDPLL